MKRVPVSVRRRSGFCPVEHRGSPQVFGMAKEMQNLTDAGFKERKRSRWKMGITMEPGRGNVMGST